MLKPIGYLQNTALSAAVNVGKGVSVAASAAVAAGGAAYLVGDTLTLSGGTSTGVGAAVFQVLTAGPKGEVLTVGLAVGPDAHRKHGFYTTKPGNAVSTTTNSAGGSGCTLTVTWTDDLPPPGTRQVQVQTEAQAVRWRDDATDPTATVGNSVAVGNVLTYGLRASRLRLIEATASAKADITFYR